MITVIDSQIGEVRKAWDEHLNRQNRKGVFVYTSDHGDQIGERYIYNKVTFFEGSAKIPLVFAGDGIKPGGRVASPASLLDISPTVCELTGAEILPEQDGKSLVNQFAAGTEDPERAVICECTSFGNDVRRPGRMVRQGKWKYFSYSGLEEYDLLFNVEDDPYELHNCLKEEPVVAARLREKTQEGWDAEAVLERIKRRAANHKLLSRWGEAVDVPEEERFAVPQESLKPPVIV
jgi:choline-sulfatase